MLLVNTKSFLRQFEQLFLLKKCLWSTVRSKDSNKRKRDAATVGEREKGKEERMKAVSTLKWIRGTQR